MKAEVEVQRTIKSAEPTASSCLLKRVIGLIKVHVDNKGIIDGLWRGERKCVNPKAGDAELWIKIWEELHSLAARDIVVEVEHAKAHRTQKAKKKCGIVRSLSRREMRKRMGRQRQEQCWMKDLPFGRK